MNPPKTTCATANPRSAFTDSVHSNIAIGSAQLEELAEEARLSYLRPRRLEHELFWLSHADHGEHSTCGAIAIYRGGDLVSYLPFRLRLSSLPLRLGEVTLARLPFRVFQLCGSGIVGDHSEASRLFTALAESALHYDGFSLEETPIDSMLWKASRMKHRNLLVFERSRASHYVADLPSNYATYFQQLSGKTRTNIRRGMKELGDRVGHWAVRKFTAPEQVREMIGLIETVATKTFHYHLLGQDLTASNQQLIDNLTLCAQKGWLRGYVLLGNDRAIAYAVGYLINGCYQYELVGYHPELAHASPGMVLLAKIVEDLIGSRAADLLDFGAGDALYKQLFGNRYYEEGAALICRRAPYAAGAAIAERLLAEASKLGARALARTGLKIRLKKLLRSNAEHAVSWSSHRDGAKAK